MEPPVKNTCPQKPGVQFLYCDEGIKNEFPSGCCPSFAISLLLNMYKYLVFL